MVYSSICIGKEFWWAGFSFLHKTFSTQIRLALSLQTFFSHIIKHKFSWSLVASDEHDKRVLNIILHFLFLGKEPLSYIEENVHFVSTKKFYRKQKSKTIRVTLKLTRCKILTAVKYNDIGFSSQQKYALPLFYSCEMPTFLILDAHCKIVRTLANTKTYVEKIFCKPYLADFDKATFKHPHLF